MSLKLRKKSVKFVIRNSVYRNILISTAEKYTLYKLSEERKENNYHHKNFRIFLIHQVKIISKSKLLFQLDYFQQVFKKAHFDDILFFYINRVNVKNKSTAINIIINKNILIVRLKKNKVSQ